MHGAFPLEMPARFGVVPTNGKFGESGKVGGADLENVGLARDESEGARAAVGVGRRDRAAARGREAR
jgi:hypothetical protein